MASSLVSPRLGRTAGGPETRFPFRPRVEYLEDRCLLTLSPLNPMLFGLNQPWSDGNTWLNTSDDPTITTKGEATRDFVARLGVQALRYPGGTNGTFWDWETGDWVSDSEMQAFGSQVYQGQIGRKQRFDANGMAGPDGFYTPAQFGYFAQQAGFEPLWVPNLATGVGTQQQIVNHAADMFNNLADNGFDVHYVEMGNELSLASFTPRFPSGTDYIRNNVHPVAARVRALDPGATIAVVGGMSPAIWVDPALYAQTIAAQPTRERNWDSQVAAEQYYGVLGNYDAVVYHNYNLNGGKLPSAAGTGNVNWQEALLAFPEADLLNAGVNARGIYGPDMKLWITEFGINHSQLTGTDPRTLWINSTVTQHSTWNALFSAGFYLSGVQQSDVYQVMMKHDLGEMMALAGPADHSYVLIDPTAQVLGHLFNVASQAYAMGPLSIPNNPILPVTVQGRNALPQFQAVEFDGPGTVTWAILNRGGTDRMLSLPNPGGYTSFERWVYRSDATVVPGGLAALPDGPAPWADGGPMSVVHGSHAQDPAGPATFWSPKYSLTFVTLTYAGGGSGGGTAFVLIVTGARTPAVSPPAATPASAAAVGADETFRPIHPATPSAASGTRAPRIDPSDAPLAAEAGVEQGVASVFFAVGEQTVGAKQLGG